MYQLPIAPLLTTNRTGTFLISRFKTDKNEFSVELLHVYYTYRRRFEVFFAIFSYSVEPVLQSSCYNFSNFPPVYMPALVTTRHALSQILVSFSNYSSVPNSSLFSFLVGGTSVPISWDLIGSMRVKSSSDMPPVSSWITASKFAEIKQ